MEAQIVLPRFEYRRIQPSRLLNLPHELLAKICSYIIPTDRVYCFLLEAEELKLRRIREQNGLYFDRGYGFPVFQTSILTVHPTIYEVCMLFWLRTSLFRFDMGADLGDRKLAGFLPDQFIRRIAHCELFLVLPFHPLTCHTLTGIYDGSFVMRGMLRRLLELLEQDGNLQELRLTVRDTYTNSLHGSRADCVPEALRLFVAGPLLEPVENLEPDQYNLGFPRNTKGANEKRLIAIARDLAEGRGDNETARVYFREEFSSGIYEIHARDEAKKREALSNKLINPLQPVASGTHMHDGKWYHVII